MIALAKRLLESFRDVTVVITGAGGEREKAKQIASQIGSRDRVFSVAGQTSLRELLTLYSISDVLVSNDSGPSVARGDVGPAGFKKKVQRVIRTPNASSLLATRNLRFARWSEKFRACL